VINHSRRFLFLRKGVKVLGLPPALPCSGFGEITSRSPFDLPAGSHDSERPADSAEPRGPFILAPPGITGKGTAPTRLRHSTP